MKRNLAYWLTFLKGFFRQVFFRNGVEKQEAENRRKLALLKRALPSKEFKELRKNLVVPRSEQICQYCNEPMLVAQGQIARFHRECRKKGRNRHFYA